MAGDHNGQNGFALPTPEKIVLSTGNLMTQGFLGAGYKKSNAELEWSLRYNFQGAREEANDNDQAPSDAIRHGPHYLDWTSTGNDNKTMYIPKLDFETSALHEERESYDITLKIFFLPDEVIASREQHIREAIDLVLKELHMPSVDLLIIQFPGIYFDEETEDCPDKIKSRGPVQGDPEPLDSQIETWKMVEKLHDEGLVQRLGVAEFGAERLEPFLYKTRIQPAVDQISLRDCCSVPRPLSTLAKSKDIELLVHNDCVNVLPRGSMRKLLDERGADIIGPLTKDLKNNATQGSSPSHTHHIQGDIRPQWVVKYTAVVKNRGVVENKGYFACARFEKQSSAL